MRTRILTAAVCAAAILAPPVAVRAGQFASIMHDWRHNQRAIDAILAGQAPYDQAQLRQAMTAYIADAAALANRMDTGTEDGRDLRRRFTEFAAAGQQALGAVSQPGAFAVDFSVMKSGCQSCHAAYNN
jgi:cytochrome c556